MTLSNITSQYDNYTGHLLSTTIQEQLEQIAKKFEQSPNIFFIGNGGSQAVCMHMSEDFLKMADQPAFSIDSTALMTCLGNDYGYEYAYAEWLKRLYHTGDTVVGVSSSGCSKNIINGMLVVAPEDRVTLSAFDIGNPLSKLGKVNVHIPVNSFGIAECVHQTALHIVLDLILERA